MQHGLPSLTMRKLAADLGVTPMALYRHVAGRDDLVEAIIDLALDDLDPVDPTAALTEQLRHLDQQVSVAFGDLPDLALLLIGHGPTTARSLAFVDAVVRGLVDAGLSEQEAAVTYATLSTLALARIALPATMPHLAADRAVPPHLSATLELLGRAAVPTVDLVRQTAAALERLERARAGPSSHGSGGSADQVR